MPMPNELREEKNKKEKLKGKMRQGLETASPLLPFLHKLSQFHFQFAQQCVHTPSLTLRGRFQICTREEHKGLQVNQTPTQHPESESFVFFDSTLPCWMEGEKIISKVNGSNGVINQVCTLQGIHSTKDMSNPGPHGFILCFGGKNNS